MDRNTIEECERAIAALEREGQGMFGHKYNEALANAILAIRKLTHETK